MVKNCGAWGSIAPPMTVDIMACLLGKKVSRAENNNKAITGTVARFVLPVRFPCGSQAGTLRWW
jgi:hypothetical protein